MTSARHRQPDALITLLLDKTSEFGDRDDAAMDLSEFDDAMSENALLRVATASDEDTELIERCGESLAAIWCRKNKLDRDAIKRLQPSALEILTVYFRTHRPEWSL